MNANHCSVCGLSILGATSYGPLHGPVFCLLCWLETVEIMQRAEALSRATDILVERQIERGLYEDLAAEEMDARDELDRRLPERPPQRGVGPMLPLGL